MPDLDLDAIEAACQAATPGPWTPSEMKDMNYDEPIFDIVPESNQSFPLMCRAEPQDARFVAAARSWVPALVARCRELEGQLRVGAEHFLAVTMAAVELIEHMGPPPDAIAPAFDKLKADLASIARARGDK